MKFNLIDFFFESLSAGNNFQQVSQIIFELKDEKTKMKKRKSSPTPMTLYMNIC